MLIWCAIVSSGLIAQLVKRGANKGKVACVRDSNGPDFTFYLDYFLFLTSLHTFNT